MKPHIKNACSGFYKDWLEVNLLPECNGKCSWCVEKGGFHPKERTTWENLFEVAKSTGKKNVLLLGGEPTLYPHLHSLIFSFNSSKIKVWMTTNGSRLTPKFADSILRGLAGINISIHHYDFKLNKEITGIGLDLKDLIRAIIVLKKYGTKVRFNCNCIKGYIDSEKEINDYVLFAKAAGADSVCFRELKGDDKNFVNITDLFEEEGIHGLNNEPYEKGCSLESFIHGLPVQFRLMCGLQTKCRKMPDAEPHKSHDILYYDGKIYSGWQKEGKEDNMKMTDNELVSLLEKVKSGKISVLSAAIKIKEGKDVLSNPDLFNVSNPVPSEDCHSKSSMPDCH